MGQSRVDRYDNEEAYHDLIDSSELFSGFSLGLWNVDTAIGFYCFIKQDIYKNALATEFYPGVKTAVTFKIDWFSFEISYSGVIQTYHSNINIQEELNNRTDLYKFWQNHISAYVKFKKNI